jgi:hypothetical protein
MWLTGPAAGPPLLASRDYLGRISSLCELVRIFSRAMGREVRPSPELVVERAAIAGFSRRGSVSAGGTCRILRTSDAHIAVNLARQDDVDALPAWIGCDASAPPWEALMQIAPGRAAEPLVERGQMFGIPVASLRAVPEESMPTRLLRMASPPPGRRRTGPLLVLDFSSLWAGPLCGHLFTQAGARVIKIESTRRPDGARAGPAAFFDLIHHNQEMLAVDFKEPSALGMLRDLMLKADVVIEASRPRAFTQLGFVPDEVFRGNPALTWISITAYGRDGPLRDRVGFGDDAAAAAGLVAFDERGDASFIGDALADPIAGLAATAGGMAAVLAGGGYLVDTPMVAAASFVANAPLIERGDARVVLERGTWGLRSEKGTEPVRAPSARVSRSAAAPLGANTAAILAEAFK